MNSTGISTGFWQWKSPIPYIYFGLAVIVATIALALIFLLFCGQNSASTEHLVETDDEIKKRHQVKSLDPEPKIVVVFAGNDKPLYIAKPLTYSPNAAQQV
ncbi:hypothetical protein FXO38_08188 [Capsicum annuum]|uniref:Uncharacterized protein n=1 Tax=Capsicum annuum TaxID=4072 RepID=A0A2G3A1U6_CAPAN|nr:hypothetical protein FXO37_23669 [Capsicum annuum]KAF3668258.1 hypothetical protein FXO38_08188 [Capsicum annuum]PHT88205.1 hypothetical protein T459_10311 [Capsicum annuum]